MTAKIKYFTRQLGESIGLLMTKEVNGIISDSEKQTLDKFREEYQWKSVYFLDKVEYLTDNDIDAHCTGVRIWGVRLKSYQK